jgi:hypothetical protein
MAQRSSRTRLTKELVELDTKGFSMDVGSADLTVPRTGVTSQTSAASIVMFGNDKKHHVIWEAPQ